MGYIGTGKTVTVAQIIAHLNDNLNKLSPSSSLYKNSANELRVFKTMDPKMEINNTSSSIYHWFLSQQQKMSNQTTLTPSTSPVKTSLVSLTSGTSTTSGAIDWSRIMEFILGGGILFFLIRIITKHFSKKKIIRKTKTRRKR